MGVDRWMSLTILVVLVIGTVGLWVLALNMQGFDKSLGRWTNIYDKQFEVIDGQMAEIRREHDQLKNMVLDSITKKFETK